MEVFTKQGLRPQICSWPRRVAATVYGGVEERSSIVRRGCIRPALDLRLWYRFAIESPERGWPAAGISPNLEHMIDHPNRRCNPRLASQITELLSKHSSPGSYASYWETRPSGGHVMQRVNGSRISQSPLAAPEKLHCDVPFFLAKIVLL